ncbi:kinase-like protein [Wolfiporia cocos MD-104 SS10]|uniref:Kinase-like protein n=1 Tax=Wolfiporia cocos (strain MD-104) TaxID=742152 RepID=A0A2H3K036_WOLCO|nr:kinase-like protein [Wolfiporia cocos MD-104 SS10]
MPTGVINTSFRILKRLCERDHYLPRSCVLPQESITMESPIPIAFGGFGEVFRAEYKTPDGSMDVAVKRYRLTPQKDSQRTRKDFCREVVVWRHLKHRNVGEFLGTHNNTQTRMSLVSKWMPNGSIKNFIKRVPTANRLQLISGTASGLAYLHSQRVIHGDLKDDNVVVDESGDARLIDFGLTTILHTADTENMITTLHTATGPGIRGTVHWMAPELFNPEAFELKSSMPSAASDIYALALVMWGVFSLQVPFHQYPLSATVIFNVLNGARPSRPEGTKELGLSDMLWDFINECWAANPADRPSIDTILNKLHALDEDSATIRST